MMKMVMREVKKKEKEREMIMKPFSLKQLKKQTAVMWKVRAEQRSTKCFTFEYHQIDILSIHFSLFDSAYLLL